MVLDRKIKNKRMQENKNKRVLNKKLKAKGC